MGNRRYRRRIEALQARIHEHQEKIRIERAKYRTQTTASAKEIENLTNEYQQVETQIRQTSPRYAALTQPQPLTLKEIQMQVLDADTLLLEYSLGEERSYLYGITHSALTFLTFEDMRNWVISQSKTSASR